MDEGQITPNLLIERKRDEAGNGTVGSRRSSATKPKPRQQAFRRTTPPPRGSGGSGNSKFDESKHKRDSSGKFSRQAGKKVPSKAKTTPVKRNPKHSIGRGDGLTQNKENAGRVKRVQAALIKQGLLSTKGGGADGKFGPLTEAAVRKWQKKSGYKVTGVLGNGQMKEIITGKKGLARRMWKERKRKEALAARKKKGTKGSLKRTTKKPSSSTSSKKKTTSKTSKSKKNQTNMYSPDRAEQQKLEQMARRNQQIERLIDLLFREQMIAMRTKSLPVGMETKVRRVRTPAGERHFDQPIGTIIVRDSPLSFLRIGASEFAGWDKVDGQDGKEYYVGQFDGEKGFVATDANDNVILEADTMDDLYQSLDRKVGESLDPKAPGDLTRVESDYPGWGKQRGGSGKEYYIGKFEGGTGSNAYEDGYLDHAAGREKWDTPNGKNNPEPEPEPEPEKPSGITTYQGVLDTVKNGKGDLKPEERDAIAEWAATATRDDLRVALSSVRAMTGGDRRKTATKRAQAALRPLKDRMKAMNDEEDAAWQEAKRRKASEAARKRLSSNDADIREANRLLENPEFADPSILNYSALEYLAHNMASAISTFREAGKKEEASKLIEMSQAANARLVEAHNDVEDFLALSAAEQRKRLGFFATLDPVDQDQYAGAAQRTYVTGKRREMALGKLQAVIRTKNEDAVSILGTKRSMGLWASGRGNSDPGKYLEEIHAGLDELEKADDLSGLYELSNMIRKTKESQTNLGEDVYKRLDRLGALVAQSIDTLSEKREAEGR